MRVKTYRKKHQLHTPQFFDKFFNDKVRERRVYQKYRFVLVLGGNFQRPQLTLQPVAMNKVCARCEKTVYPIEELKCLDKVTSFQVIFKRSVNGFCASRAPAGCLAGFGMHPG